LSLTATLKRLVELGIVPIINENDVVTGLQLDRKGPRVFSDNDMLSALVASGVDADGLALLTDVEGVFNMPPDQPGAKRISVYSPEADIAIGHKSTMGRGGMASKISAASLAAEGGVNTVVASGYDVANVNRVFDGSDIGTLFKAGPRPTSSQRWLSFMAGADGSVQLRKSAAERMMASTEEYPLLMEDITNVSGSFDAKEPVRLLDHNGQEFARAITQKSAEDITATIEGEGNLLASLKLATPSNVYFIPNPQ
jgi:glutamate 5-kinase